ncbi:MAG: chaperone modulator CbpM [Burkholderiales bacterium]
MKVIATGVCIGVDAWLDLETLAQASGVQVEYVHTLIDEGLIEPPPQAPALHFGSTELARVRRIRRLQHDFEANLQSVAVMLDLIDEVERLHAAMRRGGLEG